MRLLILPALLALTACANGPGLFNRMAPATASVPVNTGPYGDIRPPGRPGEEGEVTEAAMTTPAASGPLGTTVASLGNAAEPGLWLKTPLVRQEGPGQVSYSGRTVTARLIPIDGPPTAGSRASLQLMQQLGAPLTGLPEFSVSR